MAIRILKIRGLTEQEYSELKEAISLTKLASVRMHKVGYAYRAVDIHPTKKQGYKWDQEQFKIIRNIVHKFSLTDSTPELLEGENASYIYARGINYLRKVIV